MATRKSPLTADMIEWMNEQVGRFDFVVEDMGEWTDRDDARAARAEEDFWIAVFDGLVEKFESIA